MPCWLSSYDALHLLTTSIHVIVSAVLLLLHLSFLSFYAHHDIHLVWSMSFLQHFSFNIQVTVQMLLGNVRVWSCFPVSQCLAPLCNISATQRSSGGSSQHVGQEAKKSNNKKEVRTKESYKGHTSGGKFLQPGPTFHSSSQIFYLFIA